MNLYRRSDSMNTIVVADRIKATYPKPIFKQVTRDRREIRTIGGTLCQYWTRHIIDTKIRMWARCRAQLLIDGGPST